MARQDDLRATVEHLAAIDRPSASPGEREAAEWIAERFRAAGLEPHVEEEQAVGSYWWPIGLLNALAAVGALVRSRLLALLAIALLVDDLDHRSRIFRRVALRKRPTWNVWAETGDPDAARTVVIVAHHDAAHGGAVFDTTLIESYARRFPERMAKAKRWPPMMWGVLLGPALAALGRRRAGVGWSLATIATMADIGHRPAVPGANDNLASVAAVLALAGERFEGVRVLLVSTGAEESNSEGMQAWGRRHFPDLPVETTTFVALETLGSGNLALAESEGFLLPHAYSPEVKDLAHRCADELGIEVWRGLHNAFASDGQIALHAGYPTMLLGGLDEFKLPANYHKPWDTPEKLDYACIDDAVRLLGALIRSRA